MVANTENSKSVLVQNGIRELTSEEIQLVNGGIVSPREIDGGYGTKGPQGGRLSGAEIEPGGFSDFAHIARLALELMGIGAGHVPFVK